MSKRTYISPEADSVPFDAGSSEWSNLSPVPEDVGDTLRRIDELIDNIDISTLTEFEGFTSAGEESTTSNAWVTKSGYPVSTDPKSVGTFKVDFTIQASNSDKEKQIGTRFQYRLNGSGSWITLGESRNAVSVDDEFQPRTYFVALDIPVEDDFFQFRWQYGQTDDGGTGSVKEANYSLGKVSD